MIKIKVGVLRGGPSSEYEISLKTGEAALANINRQKYEPLDILIDKKGIWHLWGLPAAPDKVFSNVDVIFNALHGEYGEDGKVQRLFEAYKIPFTGSGAYASALAMQKKMAKDIFSLAGILTPLGLTIKRGENIAAVAAEAVRKIGLPLISKPADRGSSIGVAVAKNIYDLADGIYNALEISKEALVERFINGREASCAVLEEFREQKHYAFPVVEIIPPAGKTFFDYESKYNGRTREICPGRFDAETKAKIEKAAIAAHISLGCRHYSRSDFIVAGSGVYLLETNTLPGLTSESLFPKATASVGLEFTQLLEHLIWLAYGRKS
jgi:D-alanine-D-alanine ligase